MGYEGPPPGEGEDEGLTFAQLQAFATTARLGSVGAAADELGVSQPAVSGAIAALRRDLGDALFTRTEGGVTLTPGGTRLASVAAEILWLAERARRTVGAPGRVGRVGRVLSHCASRRRAPSPST